MKNALTTWKWSILVVARSLLALLAVSAVVAVGLYGAYRWLWFPAESAVYLMAGGILWGALEFFVLVSVFAATASAANDAAAVGAHSLQLPRLVRFSRSGWLRSAAFIFLAILFIGGVHSLFSWVNSYSLEVASWLTFRSEKPVAQESAEAVLNWVENFLWVVVLGFLLGFLVTLTREGWRGALRAAPRLLANSCWRTPFPTGLISVFVFGGLAYLLATWHPVVSPGFLDYSQAILRNGTALLLTVAGWLFWIVALAHFSLATGNPPHSSAAK
ncbi:MAG: hypothetical protein HY508_11465 [Acidobacteria bacterium]|nr:hypothetical protein [Acidobacteriota bacterium]